MPDTDLNALFRSQGIPVPLQPPAAPTPAAASLSGTSPTLDPLTSAAMFPGAGALAGPQPRPQISLGPEPGSAAAAPAATPPAPQQPDPMETATKESEKKLVDLQAAFLNNLYSTDRIEKQLGGQLGDIKKLMADSLKPFQPPPQTPPMQQWGSAAMIFAAIGSMFTRQPMTTALNAMAGVMNAYRKGDQQAFDNSMEVWKANSDQAIKLADFEMQSYHAAMENVKERLSIGQMINEEQKNAVIAKLMANAGAFDDKIMSFAAQNGLTDVMDALSKRAKINADYAENSNKLYSQLSIEKAIREYKADPANAKKSQAEQAEDIKAIMNQYSGGTGLSDDAIHDAALLAAAGYKQQAEAGLAFSGNQRADRAKVLNEASELRRTMTPGEIASSEPVVAYLQGQGALTEVKRLGNIQANIEVRANNALQASQRVLSSSAAVPRGKFVPANIMTMNIQQSFSDPALQTYYINIRTFVKEYTAALNNGQSRVYDQDHAIELINQYGDKEQVAAAMKALQLELTIALNSPGQLERIRLQHPDEPLGDLLFKQEQEAEKAGPGGTVEGAVAGGKLTRDANGNLIFLPNKPYAPSP